jgi:hypothetical protein
MLHRVRRRHFPKAVIRYRLAAAAEQFGIAVQQNDGIKTVVLPVVFKTVRFVGILPKVIRFL